MRLEFRVAVARNASEVSDLDNLSKPTLDAMDGVFGVPAMERTIANGRRQSGSS
jgi:hypothetical protein